MQFLLYTMKTINVILITILITLTIYFYLPLETTGQFDYEDPICTFYNNQQANNIPLDLCCPELEKQLECKNFKCYVKETSDRFYVVNGATLDLCKKEGYHVQVG